MAFSLEAALVVPLAMGAWMGLLLTAAPAYAETREAARVEVLALADAIRGDSLYHIRTVSSGQRTGTSLTTSPQRLLELTGLVVDDIRLLTGALTSLTNGSDKKGSQP